MSLLLCKPRKLRCKPTRTHLCFRAISPLHADSYLFISLQIQSLLPVTKYLLSSSAPNDVPALSSGIRAGTFRLSPLSLLFIFHPLALSASLYFLAFGSLNDLICALHDRSMCVLPQPSHPLDISLFSSSSCAFIHLLCFSSSSSFEVFFVFLCVFHPPSCALAVVPDSSLASHSFTQPSPCSCLAASPMCAHRAASPRLLLCCLRSFCRFSLPAVLLLQPCSLFVCLSATEKVEVECASQSVFYACLRLASFFFSIAPFL